jgi:hypothetical protein
MVASTPRLVVQRCLIAMTGTSRARPKPSSRAVGQQMSQSIADRQVDRPLFTKSAPRESSFGYGGSRFLSSLVGSLAESSWRRRPVLTGKIGRRS